MFLFERRRGVSLVIPGLFFFLTLVLFGIIQANVHIESGVIKKIWVIVMTLLPIVGFITAIKGERRSFKPWLIIGNLVLILIVSVMGVMAIIS
ncbi:hypothetical protein Q0N35_13375 [Priestia koreensis]|nr:hypothetical protein [Priestia koreensis]